MLDHPAAIALFIVAVLMLIAGIRVELSKTTKSTPVSPDAFFDRMTEYRNDFA